MPLRIALLLSAATLTVACSDGGDAATATTDLRTESGVRQELRNVIDALSLLSFEGEGGGAKSAVRQSAHKRRGPIAKATTDSCDGGSVTSDDGFRTETFRFFGNQAVNVRWYVDDSNNCRYDLSSGSVTLNGREEWGCSSSGVPPYLCYSVLGNGGTPFQLRLRDSADGSDFTLGILGRSEERESSTDLDYRVSAEFTVSGRLPELGRFDGRIQLGRPGAVEYFREQWNASDGSIRMDGRLAYQAQGCRGDLTLTTLQPLRFGQGDYPSAGQVRMVRGGDSVTYTFTGSTVVWQSGSGASGSFSVASIPDELSC